MDLSIFETMERTAIVDRLLFWSALFLPLFTAGLAFVLRDEKVVQQNRHRWVLMALIGPGVLVLWHVYNNVVDHFGLDSVKGLVVNVTIFIVAALLFTGLRILLKALITAPPPPPVVTTSIPTQRFTTMRMRSLNPDPEPENPAQPATPSVPAEPAPATTPPPPPPPPPPTAPDENQAR